MSAKAKKGKRKKQKAGLNKSILDVGMGMIKSALKAKLSRRKSQAPRGDVETPGSNEVSQG